MPRPLASRPHHAPAPFPRHVFLLSLPNPKHARSYTHNNAARSSKRRRRWRRFWAVAVAPVDPRRARRESVAAEPAAPLRTEGSLRER